MKEIQGVEELVNDNRQRLSYQILAERLLEDMRHSHFLIFGRQHDITVVLADLPLAADALVYDAWDKRLDLMFSGVIQRDDCVPLTYRLQGQSLSVSGRCSMIPKVCGVDLYLSHSYSGREGDRVYQKFAIKLVDVMKLYRNEPEI